MKLLIVEDEIDLNRVLTKRLKKEGYSVDSCSNGNEALDFISVSEYDGIVLDVMMPIMNGFEFLKRIRDMGINTPVLFLTAKDEIEDRVNGLDLGGDDYLVKPFAFAELLARIRVIIRKSYGKSTNELCVGNLRLNLNSHEVKRGDRLIDLTAKEYSVLEFLMQNSGHILSRDQIQNHVWDYDYEGASNMIDVYIKNLRKKVENDNEEKLIKTIRGMGYVIRENDKDD